MNYSNGNAIQFNCQLKFEFNAQFILQIKKNDDNN